ncbi:MAG TPA: AAA family ATPase [Candidatus Woesebacteria bacterium]|nr:AAA family ATPase [Candidatus Woesebacteria bacterium]
MHLIKVVIKNFKCFQGEFSLDLESGLNILVGDNEAGKSTILEAIHLALSGWIYGKYITNELTQALFNTQTVKEYIDSLKTDQKLDPPNISIELFLEIESDNDSVKALFEGNYNSTKQKACGLQFTIAFNDKYQTEYEILLNSGEIIESLPIEFYEFSWSTFARDDRLTPKIIPMKSAFIDSSNNRYQNGSDVYISRIVKDNLSDEDKIKVSQAHRRLQSSFANDGSIKDVNTKLSQGMITDSKRVISLSVDLSTKSAWENSLTTYLDEVPFSNIGKGEQTLIKTKLALNHKKTDEASVLLIEEPENHLSHSKLNKLIKYITDTQNTKQIIISTHSSFVANKLGLDNLILLNKDVNTGTRSKVKIDGLDAETEKYFKTLSGYDTLRLILCRKAILVEGPSDELIVQKAYLKQKSKLPIDDEVDVISVGTSFLRFLEIAKHINKPVAVVTDNDGDVAALKSKYSDYLDTNKKDFIEVCFDDTEDTGSLTTGKNNKPFNYNTLEPKLVKANNNDLSKLNTILGTDFKTLDELYVHMRTSKTDCALKIFLSQESLEYPQYILDSVNWEYEQE